LHKWCRRYQKSGENVVPRKPAPRVGDIETGEIMLLKILESPERKSDII